MEWATRDEICGLWPNKWTTEWAASDEKCGLRSNEWTMEWAARDEICGLRPNDWTTEWATINVFCNLRPNKRGLNRQNPGTDNYDSSLRPAIPATIITMQMTWGRFRTSLNRKIPRSVVPTMPKPVHMA